MQYTWSVPQDLAALASLMGGDAAAASKLETFMSSLNATRNAPYDWSGNEPGEWAPWEFDYFGAPDETSGPCAPSWTPNTPTHQSTSRVTTTSAPSRRGTCGRPWVCSP